MTLKSILYLAIPGLIACSCGNDVLDVDASEVSVDIAFVNVDSTFVHSDSISLLAAHKSFKNDISDIYALELGQFIKVGDMPDSAVYPTIQEFVNDDYIKRLEARIQDRFKDKSEIKTNIVDGFKHLKYHFTDVKTPSHVVFLNTLFQSSASCTENEVGIGLELYLGNDERVVQELPPNEFHLWIKEAMDEQYIERDVLTAWIMSNVLEKEPGGVFAENMIHWGKILYAVEASFPDMEKHKIIRYTAEDYQWAQDNEFSFWDYLVNEKLLFKVDERTRMNMLSEGPFTPGLPEKGPDRLGQYLGWQMVRRYNEEEGLDLPTLMALPYNEILQSYEID